MGWSDPVVTVAPASEPVTIEQARRQCRLAADDTSFDDELTDYIAAARAHVEQYTGTPLVTRTITAKAEGFGDLAWLPVAPVQSITSIGYVDTAGDDQVVDSAVYEARLDGLEPEVVRLPGKIWPATRPGSRITLTAVAGYSSIPDDVIHALKLLVRQFFDEHAVTKADGWTWCDSLLCNHRAGS